MATANNVEQKSKCDGCGIEVKNNILHNDARSGDVNSHYVCVKCYNDYPREGKCGRCGVDTDSLIKCDFELCFYRTCPRFVCPGCIERYQFHFDEGLVEYEENMCLTCSEDNEQYDDEK